MADLFDYLYWRGDLGMRCLPFTPVDGLILSWFAALPHQEPVPQTLGHAAEAVLGKVSGETEKFARMMSESARFRHMPLMRFEERFSEAEQMQFAALTLLTDDGHALIAYRSTDATLVGWKEDLNMAFSEEVPAQREALKYLNETAKELRLPLRLCGHSKGGNLAVYAAARCEPQVSGRIEAVYNFDGPGMSSALVKTDGYRKIEPRIETFLPEASVVGILLEQTDSYRVVKSDNAGVMQHAPSSWQVMPSDFVYAPGLSRESRHADRAIRAWLEGMSLPERRVFVDGFYEMVRATGAKTVGEIAENWAESGGEMLDALSGMDFRTKAALFRGVGGLIASAVKNYDVP